MSTTSKKIASLLLALVLLFTMVPASVMATRDDTATSTAATPGKQPEVPLPETEKPSAYNIATPTGTTPTPTPGISQTETTPSAENTADGQNTLLVPNSSVPALYQTASMPLVHVVYHYYAPEQNRDVQTFEDYFIKSSHAYGTLALLGELGLEIPANHYYGTLPASTGALEFRVLLNAGAANEQDITARAVYHNGVVALPEAYLGQHITVEWYRPTTEIVVLPVEFTICAYINGNFVTTSKTLSFPSNTATISVPVPATAGVVVSQSGIDLDKSMYSIEGGMLNIQTTALGGDIKVSAYALSRGMLARGTNFSTVSHNRGEQHWYGYYTSYYTANGNVAFCLDPTVSGLDSGTYPVDRFLSRGSDSLLIKCAYYLYGGPGYDAHKNIMFQSPDAMTAYGLSHAAAAYVYLNNPDAFKGLASSTVEQLHNLIAYVSALPMPPNGFDVFLYNTGSSTNQPLMGWDNTPDGGEEPEPEPEPEFGDVEIQKASNNAAATGGNSCYSLQGAVFEVYNSSGQRVGTITTDSNGRGRLTDLPVGTGYYAVETTPPKGFAVSASASRVNFTISADRTTTVQVVNIAQGDPASILLRKKDAQLAEGQKQGGASLAGAQFTIKYYKGIFSTQSALGGQTPFRTWVVKTDADGFALLHPTYLVSGDALFYDSSGTIPTLPLGTVTIQETKPPEGYLINNELFIRTITANGQMEPVHTYNEPIVPENVIRGGVSIEKWDFDLNRRKDSQGDATLEGAVFEIYNRTGSNVIVGNTTYANNALVHTMATDAEGTASTANDLLPYGQYEIVEKAPPAGYLNTGVVRQTFNITSNGAIVSLKTSTTAIKNNVVRGGVEIEKWDVERDERTLKQGDATLEGAVLEIWNRSKSSVVVDGSEYAPNTVVSTMITDAAGRAGTATDLLPYGSYEIIEKTPPTGYLNTGTIKKSFQIREQGIIVALTTSEDVIKNDIIRGGVRIEKWDNEINEHRAQGGATLEGAIFEIVNKSADSVLVQEQLYAVDEIVYTFATDETGSALTPVDLLPYGTYLVREVSPPDGYLATGVLSQVFTIREHGKIVELDTSETAIKNNPIRGDLKGVKTTDGDAGRLAGVPFQITSKTTGEAHTIITDKNGMFDTSTNWNPHSQNTNRGETDRDGIWFGELDVLNNDLGALLYDDYILEELPSDANADKELLRFEVSIYRHMTVVDLGTITNDYIAKSEIFTTAMDKETTQADAYVAETTTILDTVYYDGLSVGKEYTLKGVLMDKGTAKPLLIDGAEITAETSFRANTVSGSVPMEFTFNALALKGKSVVVFETLEQDGKEIATHADIEDAGQTITFHEPSIRTSAAGPDGKKELDAQAEVTIIDTVSYEGLIPGKNYTLKGTLMDKSTGKPLLIDGKEIRAEKAFTPETATGTVEVPFIVNALSLKGKAVVVFETLEYITQEIAVHADINDAGQTVQFKDLRIGTSAAGKNGEKELAIEEKTTIVDTVSYENLIPGKAYVLKGILMDKGTGKPLIIDNKEVTAEKAFTPGQASGKVEIVFTLNSLGLLGKELVVFERLYCDSVEIATHTDINDAGQTVRFKGISIKTNATSEDNKKIIPVGETVKIIDVVSYENLIVGEQYTLTGTLMNKKTGKVLLVDGKEVTAETKFKPGAASGNVQVVFTLNTTTLDGAVIVVFETLSHKDELIAEHADINDTAQTVEVRKRTVPKTGDESNLLLWLILLGVGCAGVAAGLWFMFRRRAVAIDPETTEIE